MIKEEVKKELIKVCQKLSKDLNEQDNRATRYPMFMIQEEKKQYTNEYGDYSEQERLDSDCWSHEDLCEKCSELGENNEELPDKCEDCESNCFGYYNWEKVLNTDTIFFTEKDCKEHIKLNHYHYHKPRSYAISAWRSPVIQKLQTLISALTKEDGKARSCYS